MRALVLAVTLMATAAQAQAPAPGSGGGGPVGASVATPTNPQGAQPPGAPSGATTAERAVRDAAGQGVIGKTVTPDTAVPGNTAAPDAGVRR